jgi:anaerobic dimethyl sulfoxide reductase subunit B (iron-sulfur subunit)
MSTQYAFFFDAAFCSGCKACQAACKDRNNLPPGVLWRRVYEVSGGGWERRGEAWTNTVFAYNLSIACNHCAHAKCAGVCPVDAYTVRPDGIVLLDSSKCIGCGYCAWACPYGAPQYDRAAGTMSKCNFCFDALETGLPPACTAACPLRVLEVADSRSGLPIPPGHNPMWEVPGSQHPFPLPGYSRTEPHLAIKSHPAMAFDGEKTVANREEVYPQRQSGWEETPLVAFTLLGQMAVGGFWAMQWLFTSLVEHDASGLKLLPLLAVGASLGLGLLASFAHLGNKRNAWRAVLHLRKSWLSREILFSLLFGAGWLAVMLAGMRVPALLTWGTALLGLALVYSMGQVYRLKASAPWNSWRTNVGFFVSAALLGLLLMAALLSWESHQTGIQIPVWQWTAIGIAVLLLLSARVMVGNQASGHLKIVRLWWLLVLAGVLGTVVIFFISPVPWRAALSLLLVILCAEGIGRWLFYEAREGRKSLNSLNGLNGRRGLTSPTSLTSRTGHAAVVPRLGEPSRHRKLSFRAKGRSAARARNLPFR